MTARPKARLMVCVAAVAALFSFTIPATTTFGQTADARPAELSGGLGAGCKAQAPSAGRLPAVAFRQPAPGTLSVARVSGAGATLSLVSMPDRDHLQAAAARGAGNEELVGAVLGRGENGGDFVLGHSTRGPRSTILGTTRIARAQAESGSALTAGSLENGGRVDVLFGGCEPKEGVALAEASPEDTTLAATSITLKVNQFITQEGQPVTWTATVSSATAGTITGTVSFAAAGGFGVVGTAPVNGGQAVLTTSTLTPGFHSVIATYTGDSNYAASGESNLAPAIVEATSGAPASVSLSPSSNPVNQGQFVVLTFEVQAIPPVPSGFGPTGAVTIFDGPVMLFAGTFDSRANVPEFFATTGLSEGIHSLTITYSGDAVFNSSTETVTMVVNPTGTALTTTTLTSSENPSPANQPITLTANVSSTTSTGTETGTIEFIAIGRLELTNGPLVGSRAVASGMASQTVTPPVSNNAQTFLANYSGDNAYEASTSSPVNQIVSPPPPDFAFSAELTPLSIVAGETGSETLTVVPTGGSTQTVSFTCSGLPSKAACNFNPPSVTLDGVSAASTTLSIQTTANSAAPLSIEGWKGMRTLVGILWLLFLLVLSRTSFGSEMRLARGIGLAGIALLVAAATGCGGGGSTMKIPNGTPQGLYTVTITASPSSGTPHTETVTVTVH